MTASDLIDRLGKHKTLGSAPQEELAWLATHGSLRRLGAGEVLSHKGVPVDGLYVVLSGHITLYVDRGSGPLKMIEWRTGDVSGMLPYSRLVSPPGDAVAQEPTDAVSSGGRVDVTASRNGQGVLVRIVDNGTGIPAKDLARIFDPFFTTKPMGQGMGLGLDIVRRLVRHNDATIEFESSRGRTEFRVILPIAQTGPAEAAK